MPRKKTIQKEKEESIEQKLEEPEKPQKIEKELYWILGGMVGLFILFFIFYSFLGSLNTFRYNGLTFERVQEGDLMFFHTIVPLVKTSGDAVNYHFYFRTDPRKNKVPIEGEIEIPLGLVVYISINETGLIGCKYAAVAIDSISRFLREGGGFEVQAAVPDEQRANEINLSYVTCENRPIAPVVLIQQSTETKITKVPGSNCYVIDVANCEILPTIEKFQIKSVLDARARTKL